MQQLQSFHKQSIIIVCEEQHSTGVSNTLAANMWQLSSDIPSGCNMRQIQTEADPNTGRSKLRQTVPATCISPKIIGSFPHWGRLKELDLGSQVDPGRIGYHENVLGGKSSQCGIDITQWLLTGLLKTWHLHQISSKPRGLLKGSLHFTFFFIYINQSGSGLHHRIWCRTQMQADQVSEDFLKWKI